ncbi:MAG: single-stranded DNA-binding protein [Candidatus Omnitrophica bacterium]|nr:single-stranded DNA-binding protein [Candidatus Omnitrophota bacterium]MDE2009875.1 single-stranded DNA-binding protein [Candidatus Omnitrophota bacterium]MDE2214343.1 single-stranded DNA-binding protein [Candidatus Omnitrophota bacterium]MDE2231092.1 single-stranded DNA-binding protein [Candidatus Omnitrophota bacterium]
MSLNSVNVMGNLTRDPEIKQISSGRSVCNLSIANNRTYLKEGEKVNEVSYFDVEVWGKAGENCAKYLTKGSGVIVEGRLKQERWEKDGKSLSHIRVTANMVHFLPKRRKNAAEPVVAAENPSEQETVLIDGEDGAWQQ